MHFGFTGYIIILNPVLSKSFAAKMQNFTIIEINQTKTQC